MLRKHILCTCSCLCLYKNELKETSDITWKVVEKEQYLCQDTGFDTDNMHLTSLLGTISVIFGKGDH